MCPLSLSHQVKQLMRKGGALQEFFSSELVTHIISDDQKSTAELMAPSDAVTVHVRTVNRLSLYMLWV